jgi:hypothetical protein
MAVRRFAFGERRAENWRAEACPVIRYSRAQDVEEIAAERFRGCQHLIAVFAPKVRGLELGKNEGGHQGDQRHQSHRPDDWQPAQKRTDSQELPLAEPFRRPTRCVDSFNYGNYYKIWNLSTKTWSARQLSVVSS